MLYINKMSSNILIISENQYKDAHKVVELNLNQFSEFLYCKGVSWDYINKDLFTGCPKALEKFEIEFGEDHKEIESKMYKLVKFPNDRIIRLCNQGSTKKNYKNTLLINEDTMKAFSHEAKRYNKGKYTEIHFSDNAQNYRNWENYIDIKVKESLNKENESN